ncbi:TraX family protein [Paenibacillus mucilaginosus 3016]|uniref:TraX family protein n=2 Tax=Paenibacillus mucilaginosus TaxID=61624 RepID=H6NNN4_9BACL|nr:TraX family protein [Paenibacillus mucilaginosus]AFC33355.1 TraX family protein [Paenibacillus mucilaginosus 3016]AFH65663.1 conjugal transfer protein TraX [Paenibacillus mucilaginosus K02]WFA21771.1 conjugal transfer protein TraX [Paenibacillus mucilaginosus]
MQWIAMIAMLIDHIGIVFFKGEQVWRWIGRLAFPLYAYGIVAGYRHTRSLPRYAKRLAVTAALAQLPYLYAFGFMQVNVVGSFLFCIGVLYVLDRTGHPAARALIIAAALVIMQVLPFEYGGYGLLLVLIYRYAESPSQMFLGHLLLNFLYYVLMPLQMLSIAGTLIIIYAQKRLPALSERSAPAWLWRGFYPGHLLLLSIAAAFRRGLFAGF